MRKLLLVAISLLLTAASGAQAADPCWMYVYRGTGDASAVPNVLGSDPAQTGQQRCVYYARSQTDLGKGNWWTIENDPVYGDVTRLHHDGSAGSSFNWRGYGFDDQVPPQCASHWVDSAKGSFPPGTTHEDGISSALRIKLTAFGRGNNSSTRQWGAQCYWPVQGAGSNNKMGPRQQIGLTWWSSLGKVYVTHRGNAGPGGGWTRICEIADQATQGGELTNTKWVDIWCSVKRHTPGGDPAVDRSYDYYCWYSYDGGATWKEPIDGNPVLNFSSESNARWDINADGGSATVEYLMDYFAVANKYTEPGALAIPAKPKTLVDTSIGEVKASPLGTLAKFNAVVTGVGVEETGQPVYYLEQPDGDAKALGRENGIRVSITSGLKPRDTANNEYVPQVGDYVRVVGTLGKLNCEKALLACSMQQQPRPQGLEDPRPLAINNKAAGGSFNASMLDFVPPESADGNPMSNAHGLLVKMYGRVTYMDFTSVFYIDDGSGLNDGIQGTPEEPVKGIRVLVNGSWPEALVPFGNPVYAVVTGTLGNVRVTSPAPFIDKVVPVIRMNTFEAAQEAF